MLTVTARCIVPAIQASTATLAAREQVEFLIEPAFVGMRVTVTSYK